MTFFKNLPSNSLPTGKPFQSNAQKFPHPGRHIAVNHSQAGCKKDARKTGKLYNFHFSTLLHLQRYYLIKIQSAFNTLCISNYKIDRFFKKQFVFSAKAAEIITLSSKEQSLQQLARTLIVCIGQKIVLVSLYPCLLRYCNV